MSRLTLGTHCVGLTGMKRPRAHLLALCLLLVGCALAESAFAPPYQSPEDRVALGGERFLRYCAPCHGRGGLGNGPVAMSLKRPPGDLTTIALRRGQFDPELVAGYIDGRIHVLAHGPGHMPVWGQSFARTSSRWERSENETWQDTELTLGAISFIVAYLRSIQVEELLIEKLSPSPQ